MIQLPLLDPAAPGSGLVVRESPRARHLSIQVSDDGAVVVVVPRRTRPSDIREFMEVHREWIERIGGDPYGLRRTEVTVPDRVHLRAIDEEWGVVHDRASTRRRWMEQGSSLLLSVKRSDNQQSLAALRHWLAAKGRRHLVPWLDRVSEQTGLSYQRVQIRGQRTRWGSCSARGTVSLNYCLLFVEPELVRYLIVHELCHTRYLSHGPRFWKLVERFEPDCRTLDRRLNVAQGRIPAWIHWGRRA